jgi:hypothetical protein
MSPSARDLIDSFYLSIARTNCYPIPLDNQVKLAYIRSEGLLECQVKKPNVSPFCKARSI